MDQRIAAAHPGRALTPGEIGGGHEQKEQGKEKCVHALVSPGQTAIMPLAADGAS
jgi:hypothetical protein